MPAFSQKIPHGDTHSRQVCDSCGWIHYENPKIVVGSVVTFEDKILLCKRAIEPRHGFWTLPAGYLEQNETTEDGARREAYEEACADISIKNLLAVYNIPHISQVQIMYRAVLTSKKIAPGIESLEVGLFDWTDIPWEDLAFPSVHWALKHFDQIRDQSVFPPFTNPDRDRQVDLGLQTED